jgi:cytochrome P450
MATIPYDLPPGPKPLFNTSNLLAFRRDRCGFLTNLASEYGDLVYFKLGPKRFFLLNNPDHIRDVLVTYNKNFTKGEGAKRGKRLLGEGLATSEGEFHRRQRRLQQPAFHRQQIAGYAATMVEYAARMRDSWKDGEAQEISRDMTRLTLAIACKTFFDTEVESEADEIGAAFSKALSFSNFLNLPFSQLLEKLPLPPVRRHRKAVERLDATIFRMIDERRRNGGARADLLSILIRARDEEGDGTGMTDEQLRDEMMTIFLAGHETVANALTWTWYLLSQNPEVEAKLQTEIDEALQGRLPMAEDYPKLSYTEMVFAESMRLYPPAWLIGRCALNDYQIDGYFIPAGSNFLISQYLVHRNEKYFPDPLKFDPERWRPEERESRPKFSYFPFGGGPRVCIGEHFAWMEGALVIATVAQSWKMRLVEGHPVEPHPMITLRPKYGMKMIVERRSK